MLFSRFSTFILVATLLASGFSSAKASNYRQLRRAVFKIHVDSQNPQMRRPWKRFSVSRGSGSGFHIGQGRIMTNAHVVANGKFITVQRDGDAIKAEAYVEAIAHDCDLAILRVKDRRYLAKTPELKLGVLPALRSPVVTIGYATGGEQVSITEGVVSRIGFRRYVHSGWHRHLLVQVDSAINPGNSGGPVIQNGAVVGVAFQANTAAENTGYAIPTPVVKRFLRDVADGQYDGHPYDGITFLGRALANSGTRRYHQLTENLSGVKVVAIDARASTYGRVLPGDIITSVDDNPIGSDGKVVFRGERVDFSVVYDLKVHGDQVQFNINRSGKTLVEKFEVERAKPGYKPVNIHSNFQPFYVYAGLIFVSLNRSFLRTFGSKWYEKAPVALRYAHYYSNYDPAFAGTEDIIVYAGKLPHAVNAFVTQPQFRIVRSIGDKRVKSLADMKEAIEKDSSPYLAIGFHFDQTPIVLEASSARKAHGEILKDYSVTPALSLRGSGDGAARQQEGL